MIAEKKGVSIQGIMDDVRSAVAPSYETIQAARSRLEVVLNAASSFHGCNRTYKSGSIAHKTANDDTDGDGGAVLDRRTYPDLSPDGHGGGPWDIVQQMRSHLRDELKNDHPDVRFHITKRAVKVFFNEPLPDGADPTVDLIVALTRKDGGLWIPNTVGNTWSASDPEEHSRLFRMEPQSLRHKWQHVVRVAKAGNKNYSTSAFSGFHLSSLAWQFVESGVSEEEAIERYYFASAKDLRAHATPDPAGISPPIKTLIDRQTATDRLEKAGKAVREARKADTEAEAREILRKVWGDKVDGRNGNGGSRSALEHALRTRQPVGAIRDRLVAGSTAVAAPGVRLIKAPRSHGDGTSTG